MIKAVIVDDDKSSVELLSNLIHDASDIQVVATFTDPLRFLKEKPRLSYDVLFLDIEMPNIDGLEIQRQETGPVVFVSGFSSNYVDQLSDRINSGKVTFLTKTFTATKVVSVINKVRSWVVGANRVQLETNKGTTFFSVPDIQVLCSPKLQIASVYGSEDPRDKVIFTRDSKPLILKRQSFDEVLAKLPSQKFFQISNQVIVSKDYIKSWRSEDLDMILFTGEKTEVVEFAVGKEYKREFKRFVAS